MNESRFIVGDWDVTAPTGKNEPIVISTTDGIRAEPCSSRTTSAREASVERGDRCPRCLAYKARTLEEYPFLRMHRGGRCRCSVERAVPRACPDCWGWNHRVPTEVEMGFCRCPVRYDRNPMDTLTLTSLGDNSVDSKPLWLWGNIDSGTTRFSASSASTDPEQKPSEVRAPVVSVDGRVIRVGDRGVNIKLPDRGIRKVTRVGRVGECLTHADKACRCPSRVMAKDWVVWDDAHLHKVIPSYCFAANFRHEGPLTDTVSGATNACFGLDDSNREVLR